MENRSDSFRWGGVELRHLIALEQIAGLGSVAAAARALGYSQPAVSQQLSTLEALVGAKLVNRRAGVRQVDLTDAGARVLRHGAAILAQAHAADADLRALERGEAGPVRLGAGPSIGARIVPVLMRLAAASAPDVRIQLTEESWEDRLLDHLESGQLDLVFGFAPLREGPFACVELMRDDYVVLVAADSPLARAGRPLHPRQLERQPLIVCAQSSTVEQFCLAHGLEAQIRHRIENNQTLIGLAAAGLGAAVLPRLAVDPSRADVVEIQLQTPPSRTVLLAWHRDRELARRTELLIELAQVACGDLTG